MIAPGNYNITAYQGATFQLNFTWSLDGNPVDLSGYTAQMKVKQSYRSADAILALSTDSEIALGGAAGSVSVTVAADVMDAIADGKYVYDIELNSGSVVTRILQGSFQVQGGVTR